MDSPALEVGKTYILTEEYSVRCGYDDRSYEAIYEGLATDGCFAFNNGCAHGVHVYFAEGYLWLDDMVTIPMTVVAK